MKIAVCYDNGQIFQHFGRTENFKIYEVVDNKVVNSEMMNSNGTGHGALAGLLAEKGVNTLICGGMGEGAQKALVEEGIEIYSGIDGDADKAVEAFLNGELVSAGSNCDHHDHDHEEEAGCGGSCGSCGGGCGGGYPQIIFKGKNAGKKVKVHYRGTLNDGSQFDSSYDKGQPLEFTCGIGMMIPGFDKAVVNMEVGEEIDIKLPPEMAYGEKNPNYFFTMLIAEMPGTENLVVGQRVTLEDSFGRPIPAVVTEKDDTNITFDANHEMAGKELNFHIEMVSVEE